MAGTTTAFCSSAKTDMMSGLQCLNGSITFTATGTSTATWTAVSALTGLAVGMALSGTNVAAGTVIAKILSSTSILVSAASTGALSTVTAVGDTYNIALVKLSPTGTYGAATTAYSQLTGNSDEVSGTGYSAGGVALTNVTPTLSGTTAMTNFSPNPSWTTATFTATGAIIYNTTQRGPVAGPTMGVYDFGGSQTVTAGTFTVLMPSETSTTAVLRVA